MRAAAPLLQRLDAGIGGIGGRIGHQRHRHRHDAGERDRNAEQLGIARNDVQQEEHHHESGCGPHQTDDGEREADSRAARRGPGIGERQTDQKPDHDGRRGDLEIDRHAGQERRQEIAAEALHQRAHAVASLCSRKARSLLQSHTTPITTTV